MTENPTPPSAPSSDQPLESWKEIAGYLKRDVRTVIRWEKSEGLPVRRHRHQARSSVYAYPHELDAWRDCRRPIEEPAPRTWRGRRPAGLVSSAAALLVALFSVGDSRVLGTTRGAPPQAGTVSRLLWAGPNVDILGAPSPDGRYVAMTDWVTGNLAARDTAAGTMRHLTENGDWHGFAEFPVPSPDGRQIAYAWYNDRTQFDLRVYSFETASTRVVYARDEVEYAQPFAWTPDGTRILATLARTDKSTQIALIAAADGSAQILKTTDWRAPGKMAISPDGRAVAYDFPSSPQSKARDIFLQSLDGSRNEVLVQHPDNDALIGWSPNGDRLLFWSDRAGRTGIWALPIADGRSAGAPQLLRADVPLNATAMGLTRQGALYYGLRTGMSDVYLASLDPGTGAVLSAPAPLAPRFVGWNRSPSWSGDGRSVAYVSRRDSPSQPAMATNGTIVIRSLASGQEREITAHLTNMGRLVRWSPDGRSFLVHGRDGQGTTGFFRIDARTGDATLLLSEGPANRLGFLQFQSWSADGKSFFYLRTTPEASNRLRVHIVETGADREVYGASTNVYAVSPDGRQVAVRAPGGEGAAGGLALVSMQGGEPRTLFRLDAKRRIPPFSALAWTPDGAQILFAVTAAEGAGQSFELWRVAASGGTPQPTGIVMDDLRDLSIDRDGRRIVFGAGQNRNEIWVMENFLPGPGR